MAAVRLDALAVTVRVCGVVREPEGETESQAGAPLGTDALTLMLLGLEEVTIRVPRTSVVLPAAPLSESALGERVIGLS